MNHEKHMSRYALFLLAALTSPCQASAYTNPPDYEIWCFFGGLISALVALLSTIAFLGGGIRWIRNLAFASLACTLGCVFVAWYDIQIIVVVVLIAIVLLFLIVVKMNRIEDRQWRDSIEDDGNSAAHRD